MIMAPKCLTIWTLNLTGNVPKESLDMTLKCLSVSVSRSSLALKQITYHQHFLTIWQPQHSVFPN